MNGRRRWLWARQRRDPEFSLLEQAYRARRLALVAFAGAAPHFIGLDQLNCTLPRSLAGRGVVDVRIKVEGKAANLVKLNIK